MGVTADGCPVEVYLRLPPSGGPEIVSGAVPAGASILELDRTHPLVALDHRVVAVDDSPEVLAHVRGAETVCARIGDLRLGRRFDVVLLGSPLLNTPDPVEALALLAAARRHLAPGGVLLVEWHPPEWFDRVVSGSGGRLGGADVALEDLALADLARDGDLLSAAVRYRVGDEVCRQEFTCRRLSPEVLGEVLTSADLGFGRWVTADRDWFSAHGVARPPPGWVACVISRTTTSERRPRAGFARPRTGGPGHRRRLADRDP